VTSGGQERTWHVIGQQEAMADSSTSNNGQCTAGLTDCEASNDDDDDDEDDEDDEDECSATSSNESQSEDEMDTRHRNRRSRGKQRTCSNTTGD